MSQIHISKNLSRVLILIVIILLCSLAFMWWQHLPITEDKLQMAMEEMPNIEIIDQPIKPIPLEIKLNPDKVALGNKLFEETLLSDSHAMSCAICHNINKGGIDGGLVNSIGRNGLDLHINTPTVFNSLFNFKQNWNGRFASLEEQIEASILNPKDMGEDWDNVVKKLQQVAEYVNKFNSIYENGITKDNIINAIATYERSLYTPNSRFDKYLRGDKTAITKKEEQGYNIFKAYGCISCHQGVNVGGNLFQKFGVFGNYFADRGNINNQDYGRFNITKNEDDRYVFKVPSLRNITLTPPYFHDGSAPNLEAAIGIMAKYQLGREISSKNIKLIIEFLQTLTGEYAGKAL